MQGADTPSPQPITQLLRSWGCGDRQALEKIVPAVYGELRRIARLNLRGRRAGQTLQTTALIHEAYLRLAADKKINVQSRDHFFGIAAQLMRWILVDHERSRCAAKRGDGVVCLSLGPEHLAECQVDENDVNVLALDQALHRLAALDAQQSQIIELRYFGGLSIEDTSQFLGVSPATVKRDWASARVWLLRELRQDAAPA
jgi:RNA polymerase sigma factor (TIGR02999 family)